MTVITMSETELNKLEIIRDVDFERMPVRAAAVVLGVTERQVWRLLKRYRLNGAEGLISRKRGHPSNWRIPHDARAAIMDLVRSRYADFGPIFAHLDGRRRPVEAQEETRHFVRHKSCPYAEAAILTDQ